MVKLMQVALRERGILRVLCLITCACLADEGYSASFNCALAKTAPELAICSNGDLSALDGRLGETYQKALESNPQIRKSQIEWITARNANCKSDVACLRHAIETRLQELRRSENTEYGSPALNLVRSAPIARPETTRNDSSSHPIPARVEAPDSREPDRRKIVDNTPTNVVTESVGRSRVLLTEQWPGVALLMGSAIAGVIVTVLISSAMRKWRSRVLSSRKKLNLEDRRRSYMNFLASEGCSPEFDGQGDIMFYLDGSSYYMLFDAEDEDFIRILLPNIAPAIEGEAQRLSMTVAAFEATVKAPIAKIIMIRNNFFACVEFYCDPPETYTLIFQRMLAALQTAARTFRKLVD
jgi:uncharacterized protein